jgi:hypothetical protein
MENLGFHKSKLYSLILAGVALISLLLPWVSVSAGGFGGSSANGFKGWGLLVLLGIGSVAASCFMGNKAVTFDDLGKKLVLGGFGAIVAGSVIYLIRILTMGGGTYGGFVKVSPGLGLFLGLIAGALGLLLALGKIKVPKSIDDKISPVLIKYKAPQIKRGFCFVKLSYYKSFLQLHLQKFSSMTFFVLYQFFGYSFK